MALSLQRYVHANSDHILKERLEREQELLSVISIRVLEHNVPESVIFEILSWLPVKELLKFKSVCKSWYTIISSSNFVSKHLENYYNKFSSNNDCLLLQYNVDCPVSYRVTRAELQLYELLVDDTPRVVAKEVLYNMPMYPSAVCGPCDGIYYLYNRENGTRALWNPAINEVKYLPSIITKPNLPSNLTYRSPEEYGFGYDKANEDYKVVVIKGYWDKFYENTIYSRASYPSSVLVYSLRTNSWRYWGDLPQKYVPFPNKCYIVVGGFFYWFGSTDYRKNSKFVISFGMGTDTIQEIQIPDYDVSAFDFLAMYDDCLAILVLHDTKKLFEIWTWNEGLWTKKFSMGNTPFLRSPVGHWKKTKLILEGSGNELVLCDPERNEFKNLAFYKPTCCE